jgi:hypothetical protein
MQRLPDVVRQINRAGLRGLLVPNRWCTDKATKMFPGSGPKNKPHESVGSRKSLRALARQVRGEQLQFSAADRHAGVSGTQHDQNQFDQTN